MGKTRAENHFLKKTKNLSSFLKKGSYPSTGHFVNSTEAV